MTAVEELDRLFDQPKQRYCVWKDERLSVTIFMNVSLELTLQELAQVKLFTGLEDEAAAVAKAVRDFVRVSQLRELKATSGKVDYQSEEQLMEALELRERHSKQ